MKQQHTPAPWEAISDSASYINIAHREQGLVGPTQTLQEIAYTPVCRVNRHAPGRANAALIMAAPDLLAACRRALGVLNGTEGNAYLGMDLDGNQRFAYGAICDLEVLLAEVITKAAGGNP